MKALLIALTLAATPLHAGGPVIVEDAYEAEPTPKLTPGQKLAIAAGLIVVGALILGGGGGSDSPCNTPDEPTEPGGC